MRHLLTLLLSVGCCFIAFSQSAIVGNGVSGIVRDGTSQVQNVYIFLKNYPDFNCLSNVDGSFSVRFPEILRNDTIVISHVGYERIEVPIADFGKSNNAFNLKVKTIGLEEIEVEAEDFSLKEMLQKVILRIPDNYPTKRHQLSGLYRKISTNYDEFTGLIEAKVKVEDVGYNEDVKRAKVEISNLRSSDDFSEVDSSYILYLAKLRKAHFSENDNFQSDNQAIKLYESNILRKNYMEGTPLNKNGYLYEFFGIIEKPVYQEFVGFDIVEKDTIYTISYGTTDPPLGSTYIKINSSDFAVVEFQVTRYLDAERELYEQFIMKYKKNNDKYFPEILVHKVMRFINRDVGRHQMDVHTFYFDSVKTKGIKKIRNLNMENRRENIDLKSYEYDSSFWENFKLIEQYPLDSIIIKSLERFDSIEEQFKSNGKN